MLLLQEVRRLRPVLLPLRLVARLFLSVAPSREQLHLLHPLPLAAQSLAYKVAWKVRSSCRRASLFRKVALAPISARCLLLRLQSHERSTLQGITEPLVARRQPSCR